jgi:hypothetical protein
VQTDSLDAQLFTIPFAYACYGGQQQGTNDTLPIELDSS